MAALEATPFSAKVLTMGPSTGLHSAAAPFGGAAATQNPPGAKLLSEVDTHEAS